MLVKIKILFVGRDARIIDFSVGFLENSEIGRLAFTPMSFFSSNHPGFMKRECE
jgi:hypothetical protein